VSDTPSRLDCRVVLVRTHIAGNLGATARVMANFGLTDLVLVAPVADPRDAAARQFSTHGEPNLDACRIVADLADAVADCVLVAATSARTGGLFRRQAIGTPAEIIPHLLAFMARGPVALVFGPEPTGLTNAEIARCHYLIRIPTDPAFSSLNLAQAVAICLYELHSACLRATLPPAPPEQPASFAEQERMFEKLRDALEQIHFLYGEKAESLMHAVRHLIGRAGPTAMEIDVLYGLARQLRWAAERMKR
jgi:tRNA/rRNA methyltransferase